jgi:hypothetical protein
MARPKLPRKNSDVNQPISPTPQPTLSDPIESPTDAVAARPVTEVTKAKAGKNTRKPEIVRANLVPINLDDEIRCLAYLLSEQRGFEPGHETEDWLNAEREVLGRYQQQRA